MAKMVGTAARLAVLIGLIALNLSFAAPVQARGYWDDDWCVDPNGPEDLIQCCTHCLWF
jgi:hypothetical protein